MWDYYLENHLAGSILAALRHLFVFLQRQYNIEPKVIECDNEFMRSNAITTFFSDQGVKVEPSALYTQAQNGGAERPGGVIKEKMRTIAIGAHLPWQLWPEIARAVVYL